MKKLTNKLRIECLLEIIKLLGHEVTCATCERENICDLAYDAYNIDGDCLWEK